VNESLLQAEVLMLCDGDRLVERRKLDAEQMSLDWPIVQTLDKRSDLRLLINRILDDRIREESSVLGVSVNVTLTLLQVEILGASPELDPRRLKRSPELGLELL
jgi:hypothetical protein